MAHDNNDFPKQGDTMTEMKTCPFCGKVPKNTMALTGGVGTYCWTDNCPIKGNLILIKAWNSRKP